MRFAEFTKGKKYQRKTIQEYRNGRDRVPVIQTFIIVDKNQDQEQILASIIPEEGKPTAPVWYNKAQFSRWKPIK